MNEDHLKASQGVFEPTPAVLDCTLRDGGYYSQWDFAESTLETYFDSVARLPISAVEVGYCSVAQPGYRGRFHYLTPPQLERIRPRLGENQELAVMIDAKEHSVADIKILMRETVHFVDLVRLAVAPDKLEDGLALARELRELGANVGVNIMYLSRWWKNPLRLTGIDDILRVASTVSLVDSYGACEPHQVRDAVSALRESAAVAQVGFHGHDNLGLAMANSLAAIEAGAGVVDATMSGMGRGAGNTSTQAILIRQAARTNARLDLDALSAVEQEFEGLKQQFGWGTSLPYMISGASDLPQKDVMEWVGKDRYTMVSIVRALKGDAESGLDARVFQPLTIPRMSDEVLLIGGGITVDEHSVGLARYVALMNPLVVHATHKHLSQVSELGAGQIVCLTGDGFAAVPLEVPADRVGAFVVASGIRLAGTVPSVDEHRVSEVEPFATLATTQRIGPVPDTAPLALGLGVATKLGAKRISLVGFDGYVNASLAKQALARETQSMINAFEVQFPDVRVAALTPSSYEIRSESLYGRISEFESRGMIP